MTKRTPEISSKPFACKPISGPSKPFAHHLARRWDPYFCKKEESCKFLFAHILSNDVLYACRIPLASIESWDFGPKLVCMVFMVCMVLIRFGHLCPPMLDISLFACFMLVLNTALLS